MGQSTPIRPARAWPEPQSREEDELLLAALSMRDLHGKSYTEIIRDLGVDCTRNKMLSKCIRVDEADAKAHGAAA